MITSSCKITRGLILKEILLILVLHAVTIRGEWSDWQSWSNCSNTCNGVISQTRTCLTNNCTGPTHQYKSCLVKTCKSTVNIRDEKCSTIKYNGWKWVSPPGSTGCSLDCIYDYMLLTNIPINMDGVPCLTAGDDKQNGICLQNTCIAITSCDGILGSSTKLNKCLQCKPYNEGESPTSCEKNTFTLEPELGFPSTLTIPSGATSIKFSYSTNNISIWTSTSPTQQVSGPSIEIGGTIFVNSNSTLLANGPVNDNVTLRAEATTGSQATKLEYYTVKQLVVGEEDNKSIADSYVWVTGEFSDCSVTCGIGLEVAHVHCRDSEFPEKIIPDSFCSDTKKPYPIVRKCLKPLCPPKWKALNWWRCNTICGGGVQSRVVQCVQYDEFGNKKVLPSSKCDASQKPPTKQPCNTHTCGQWKLSEWSDCVPNCGQGHKNRSVICVNENNEEIDSINCRQPIPASVEPCFNEPCYYKWTPGPWGICSNLCGNGFRYREVYCTTQSGVNVSSDNCKLNKPPTTMPCFESFSCTKEWITTGWGTCEGPCGVSYQFRNVTCCGIVSDNIHNLPEELCKNLTKPITQQPCNQTNCPLWFAEPWSECSATCGDGTKTRIVRCILPNGSETTGCSSESKPVETTTCQISQCPTTSTPGPNCKDNPKYACNQMVSVWGCIDLIKGYCCRTCFKQ